MSDYGKGRIEDFVDNWIDCRHRVKFETYQDSAGEDQLPFMEKAAVEHWVQGCEFADNYTERFENMPRWLTNFAFAGGPNFQPHRHCEGCPAYEPLQFGAEKGPPPTTEALLTNLLRKKS